MDSSAGVFSPEVLDAEDGYLDDSDATYGNQNSQELASTIEFPAKQERKAYSRKREVKQGR